MSNATVAAERARHWIGGSWVDSAKTGTSINPTTNLPMGEFADGGRAEAEAAVASARRAFDTTTWSRDRKLRAAALLELADQMTARAETIALTLSREMGKTLTYATFEATVTPGTLRHNAGMAMVQTGSTSEISPGVLASSWREAIGVAALIVPWNAPVALLLRALGPALAAGCTVAIKLPAQTALTNYQVMQAVAATKSLPPGVVNIFTESSNEGAPFLVGSTDVDVINYTGSTKVGRSIAAQAAQTLKTVCLELGGKTPLVVFDDMDVEVVAPIIVRALTQFNGQFCMTGSRVLVQETVADAYRTKLSALLEAVKVGPADDFASEMGPLVDQANVTRVERFVTEAQAYSKVLVRGGPITEGPLAKGAYFRPALLEPNSLDSPLVQLEVFAPVLSFETFKDEPDALRRANATEFGLAAAVFTADRSRAHRVAQGLKAGTVWTNCWGIVDDALEEGGFKQSGVGRARGVRGVEEFQEIKTRIELVDPLDAPR
jgi:acyl-CoA reductase-like NAD-dependent aldehyde dehydrogenase